MKITGYIAPLVLYLSYKLILLMKSKIRQRV